MHCKKGGKTYDGSIQWEQLAALGLKIREVLPDGNCFFRAVADQQEGSQEGHARLRASTVDYIQLNSPRWHIRNFEDPSVHTIHLQVAGSRSYHDGEHYNSVRRVDDDEPAPAKPILIEADAKLAGAPAAAAAGAGAPGTGGDARALQAVRIGTGCVDVAKIQTVLEEMRGDTDAAIEYLIAADASEDENAELSSGAVTAPLLTADGLPSDEAGARGQAAPGDRASSAHSNCQSSANGGPAPHVREEAAAGQPATAGEQANGVTAGARRREAEVEPREESAVPVRLNETVQGLLWSRKQARATGRCRHSQLERAYDKQRKKGKPSPSQGGGI
eukprot:jgi/Mesen1/6334/ME000328S05624